MSAVLLERGASVATITLNRPDSLNALNIELIRELHAAVATVVADPSVRCVLLTGAGRAFCAGGDITEFGAKAGQIGAHVRELSSLMHEAQLRLMTAPKPVVIGVHGAAAGGGFGLALSADVVIAAESARFTSAYARIGAAPDGGFTFLVPRLIGLRRAQELYFTDRVLSAAEAHALGLVTRVVPDGDLASEIRSLATRLAAGPTRAYALAKQLFATAVGAFESQLERESLAMAEASETDDFARATNAFREKRTPEFRGR